MKRSGKKRPKPKAADDLSRRRLLLSTIRRTLMRASEWTAHFENHLSDPIDYGNGWMERLPIGSMMIRLELRGLKKGGKRAK